MRLFTFLFFHIFLLSFIMYTLYGFISSIATVIFFSFINNITTMDIIKFIFIALLSILLQPIFCHSCLTSYSLAAYLATFPLLISLLFNCNKIHMFIFAFAIASAIGRIACLFSGCCTGKITTFKPFSIFYPKGTVIADHLHRDVYVYPTIYFEILIEFFIAFFVLFSEYGLLFFGIINFCLLILTSWWRYTPRMGNNLVVPLVSLALFTLIIHYKQCYNLPKIQFVFKLFSVPFAILFGLILSSDFHIIDLLSFIKHS